MILCCVSQREDSHQCPPCIKARAYQRTNVTAPGRRIRKIAFLYNSPRVPWCEYRRPEKADQYYSLRSSSLARISARVQAGAKITTPFAAESYRRFRVSQLACIAGRNLSPRGDGFVSKLGCILARVYRVAKIFVPGKRICIDAWLHQSSRLSLSENYRPEEAYSYRSLGVAKLACTAAWKLLPEEADSHRILRVS